MIYSECDSTCPRTCKIKYQNVPCINKCIDGCVCPSGYVKYNDTCILGSECPCTHNDKIYQKGETIQKDCNKWYISFNLMFQHQKDCKLTTETQNQGSNLC